MCTSLLVDQRIGGACHGWALVGAYGRVSGVLSNGLANLEPSRAHAVLRARGGGGGQPHARRMAGSLPLKIARSLHRRLAPDLGIEPLVGASFVHCLLIP